MAGHAVGDDKPRVRSLVGVYLGKKSEISYNHASLDFALCLSKEPHHRRVPQKSRFLYSADQSTVVRSAARLDCHFRKPAAVKVQTTDLHEPSSLLARRTCRYYPRRVTDCSDVFVHPIRDAAVVTLHSCQHVRALIISLLPQIRTVTSFSS